MKPKNLLILVPVIVIWAAMLACISSPGGSPEDISTEPPPAADQSSNPPDENVQPPASSPDDEAGEDLSSNPPAETEEPVPAAVESDPSLINCADGSLYAGIDFDRDFQVTYELLETVLRVKWEAANGAIDDFCYGFDVQVPNGPQTPDIEGVATFGGATFGVGYCPLNMVGDREVTAILAGSDGLIRDVSTATNVDKTANSVTLAIPWDELPRGAELVRDTRTDLKVCKTAGPFVENRGYVSFQDMIERLRELEAQGPVEILCTPRACGTVPAGTDFQPGGEDSGTIDIGLARYTMQLYSQVGKAGEVVNIFEAGGWDAMLREEVEFHSGFWQIFDLDAYGVTSGMLALSETEISGNPMTSVLAITADSGLTEEQKQDLENFASLFLPGYRSALVLDINQ